MEYGMALEVMHTDKEWTIDPNEPLIWAPPCPPEKVAAVRHACIFNFQHTRLAMPALAEVTEIEFVHGPCCFYIETIYEMSDDDEILYYPSPRDEPIILDTITHYDTWVYSFGWYVNPGDDKADLSGAGAFISEGKQQREVIGVPLNV